MAAAQPVSRILTNPDSPPSNREATKAVGPVAAAIAAGQVYTTEEEVRVFEVVKRLCAESQIQRPVGYKDTVNYFAVNLGKVSHWFLRFVIRDDRKFAISRLPVERAAMLAPGFKVEPVPDGSRVYYRSLDDLDKLRSLILVSYEDEARRRERSEDDDEEPAPVT